MNAEDVVRLITRVRFTPVRIRESYAMGDVDELLEELEREAQRAGDLGVLVRAAEFTRVKWREGYDIDEVDEFLRELSGVEVTAPAPSAPMVADSSAWAIRGLVERARFTPVRLRREGYDMAEVDTLLDQVVEAAERGEPVAPLIDRARLTPVRMREGYDMGEVDQLLAQLKGGTPATMDPGVIQEQRGLFDRFLGRD